jgi:iron complex outermembrane receptor protein
VDFTHTSEMYNDVQNTPLLRRPKEDMINSSAALVSPNGKVTFTLGGVNLTDRRFITTGQPQIAGGAIYGTYDAPRDRSKCDGRGEIFLLTFQADSGTEPPLG